MDSDCLISSLACTTTASQTGHSVSPASEADQGGGGLVCVGDLEVGGLLEVVEHGVGRRLPLLGALDHADQQRLLLLHITSTHRHACSGPTPVSPHPPSLPARGGVCALSDRQLDGLSSEDAQQLLELLERGRRVGRRAVQRVVHQRHLDDGPPHREEEEEASASSLGALCGVGAYVGPAGGDGLLERLDGVLQVAVRRV